MATVSLLVTLYIPSAHSLKEKRSTVRSLISRLRTRRQLSVAEVGLQDRIQQAQIGIAIVSGNLKTARQLATQTQVFVDNEVIGQAEVVGTEIEESLLTSEQLG